MTTSPLRKFLFGITAIVTMTIGAQCVHAVYKPLDNLDELVQQRLEEKRKELENAKKP